MSIKDQIRAEIEQRMAVISMCNAHFFRGRLRAYKDILCFLDSLPDEPTSMTEEILEGKIGGIPQKETLIFEGLEEEYDRFAKSDHHQYQILIGQGGIDLARHFAEWQKEKDEKDLSDMLTVEYLRGVEWGKQDTKKQMMEEAVEVQNLVEEGRYCQEIGPIFLDERAGFKPGDKVRIIILKAEEE